MKKELKLNLGCGTNKIDGFVNIDVEESCKPDKVCNFLIDKLPYKDKSVDEIVLFHCIEHITKRLHFRLLNEIWRVLKPSGRFLVSYPEFTKCVDNWKKNYRGKRQFWEATIFGRQLYPSDAHVCIMHTPDFLKVLKGCGFQIAYSGPEPEESYNTIIHALKGTKPFGYEDLIRQDQTNIKIKRIKK